MNRKKSFPIFFKFHLEFIVFYGTPFMFIYKTKKLTWFTVNISVLKSFGFLLVASSVIELNPPSDQEAASPLQRGGVVSTSCNLIFSRSCLLIKHPLYRMGLHKWHRLIDLAALPCPSHKQFRSKGGSFGHPSQTLSLLKNIVIQGKNDQVYLPIIQSLLN